MPFFFGMAVFGVYKSLDLSRQNAALKTSLDETNHKLAQTETSLKETKDTLRERFFENAKLDGEVRTLKMKLEDKEQENQGYLQQISLLTQKIKEAGRINVSLLEQQNTMTGQLMRLGFENAEMKKTLSSVQELKKAIRDLKIRKKNASKQAETAQSVKKPAEKKVEKQAEKKYLFDRRKEEATETAPKGNAGFFVKDGRSTFEGLVEIRVIPEESGAEPSAEPSSL